MSNVLRVLDAARSVVDDVNQLLDAGRPGLIYDIQLRDSAGSIAANIREALGRREGAERNQFFRVARSSAEETDEHLRANFRSGRMPERQFWRLHNRLVTIVRMLNSLMQCGPTAQPQANIQRRTSGRP